MGRQYVPLPSFKGSELWGPVFKAVYDRVIINGFIKIANKRGLY